MSLLLAAQRALTVPGWAKDELSRKAQATPSLDLRFADSKSLVDATTGQNLVSFTRASSGTYVDSQGVIKTATTDQARFDHNPTTGESLGLLVEESRTNLFQRSEEFENTYWSKANAAGTVTADQATSPDGANTADLYQEDTANTGRYLSRSISFTSGTSYTISIWAKQASGATRYLGLILPTGAFGVNVGCVYVLSDAGTATITTSGTNTTASIQAFPSGWYRCILSSQATTTASVGIQIRLSNSSTAAGPTYTGDGSSGLYIWGAQLEAGAFFTSYIPTTTATVTRSADVASISGSNFSSWYRQDEGTVFADAAPPASNSAATTIVEVGDGTVSNRIGLLKLSSSGNASLAVLASGSQVVSTSSGAWSATGRLVGGYKTDDFASSFNGAGLSVDATGSIPAVTQLSIGRRQDGVNLLNGTIRRLTYWPQRLPNSTLQAITQ